MLSAYLDTNVYDHIDKGRISEDDVVGLHAALSSKRLGILLGIGDVEELLGHWEADRAEVLRALRLIEAVAGFGRLVRQPHEILEEAIRAYAEEAPPPSMLASPAECLVISDVVGRILTDPSKLSDDILKIVERSRALKERHRRVMLRERGAVLAERMWKTYGRIPEYPFRRVWERRGLEWAEAYARQRGLADQCQKRGLEGLLAVRAVRIAVGAVLSLIHSQVIERRAPRPSDVYDLLHALTASAADVFVTCDRSFARLLGRVPIDNFTVVTSIKALLEYADQHAAD